MMKMLTAPAWPRKMLMILGAPVAATVSACGSSSNAGVTSGNGASCASRSASAYLASAQIAFIGIMLPGPAASTGQGNVLISPARVRVTRYLKGSGPHIVTVITAVTRNGSTTSVNEDGIQAFPGQSWRIYGTTQHMPYMTSICAGSTQLVGTPRVQGSGRSSAVLPRLSRCHRSGHGPGMSAPGTEGDKESSGHSTTLLSLYDDDVCDT
jgi:hypothetical protein